MTPRHQEIFDRSKARATAGWNSGFLTEYKGTDLQVARLGFRTGVFARIRLAAIIEDERRAKPEYSRWLP